MPVTLTTKSRRFMPNPVEATLTTPAVYTGTAVSVDLERTGWHDVTLKEQAASRGAYQAGDQLVSLGYDELDDTVPGVGWRITQGATGLVYTILEVVQANYLGFYRCTARNLALAAGLYETCTIKRPSSQRIDRSGNREPVFATLASSVPCRFQEESAQEVEWAGKRVMERRFTVFFDTDYTLTNEDQLVRSTGAVHEIVAVTNRERIDEISRADTIHRGY